LSRNKYMLLSIAVIGLLLVGAALYIFLEDNDPYKHYTGLGDSFDLSSDNQTVVFSYYLDGKEAIFSADRNGENVKQLTRFGSLNNHQPQLSSDGKHLLYLARDEDGNNSLYVANSDGSSAKKITSPKLHIFKALFSASNDTIYFTAMPAEDFHKAEGETKEGQDIYSITINGTEEKQWTDRDYFSIDTFLFSPEGTALYYGEADGYVYTLALDKRAKKEDFSSELGAVESYSKSLSPDGSKFAYTAVSKESEKASLYEYELFLRDLQSGKTTRLTNLKTSVTAPEFFRTENKMAFLEQKNWPSDPAEFIFTIIELDTKKLEKVTFKMPKSIEKSYSFGQFIDSVVNWLTISILYILFIGLISMHQRYFRLKKGYLPPLISLLVAILGFIASIIAAMNDPWAGIAIGMLSAGVLGCTLIVFIFVFLLNLIRKREA